MNDDQVQSVDTIAVDHVQELESYEFSYVRHKLNPVGLSTVCPSRRYKYGTSSRVSPRFDADRILSRSLSLS